MANGLKILAYDSYGFGSDKQKKDPNTKRISKVRTPRAVPAGDPVPGWEVIHGWQTDAEFEQKLNAVVQRNPGKPIEVLRISAHGSPVHINGIGPYDIAARGAFLKTLPWMDEAKIYLGSCNSGLTMHPHQGWNPPGPVAKLLADAMPFDPNAFAHKITVHGTRGYGWSSLTTFVTKVTKIVTEDVWITIWVPIGKYFGKVRSVPIPFKTKRVTHTAFPNAVDETGDAMWNKFKNGNW